MCGCNRGVAGRVAGRVVGRVAGRIVGRAISEPDPVQVPVPVPVQSQSQSQGQGQGHVRQYRFNPGNNQNFNPRLHRFQRGQLQVQEQVQVPVKPQYDPETTVWGPSMWIVLHTLAEFSTNLDLWNPILTRLTTDIPCVICREHFTTYLQSHPVDTMNPVSIVNWFFILHNDVNQRINKQILTSIPSFDSYRPSLTQIIQGLSVSFPPEVLDLLLQSAQSIV
jgi:hypothetical protein